MLSRLLSETGAGHVTLDCLTGRLGGRSFGVVMLVLGLLGVLPGVSVPAGVLLMVPAVQMILARPHPEFPRAMARRRFRAQRLVRLVRLVVPVLRFLERFVHPRRPAPARLAKRMVGSVILLLGAGLLVPLPLSNVPLALATGMIAFAYLEEDGVVLCAALASGLAVFGIVAAVSWQAARATGRLQGLL